MTRRASGIDVSSVQNLSSASREIDWEKVAGAGFSFVIAKATTGRRDNDEDSFTARNLAGAQRAGLLTGVYHFWIPGVPADLQAANVEAHIDAAGITPDLPICIDFEWPEPDTWAARNLDPKSLAPACLALVHEIAHRTGRTPILYTYPYFFGAIPNGAEKTELTTTCPLWIAGGDRRYLDPWIPREDDDTPDVANDAEHPSLPAPWMKWSFWQYSGGGVVTENGVKKMKGGKPVPGINGLCDRNLFNGSVEELRAFCAGSLSKFKSTPPPEGTDKTGMLGIDGIVEGQLEQDANTPPDDAA